jgi:hypothetical protein
VTGFWASKEGRKVRMITRSSSKNPLILVANNHDLMQVFEWKAGPSL